MDSEQIKSAKAELLAIGQEVAAELARRENKKRDTAAVEPSSAVGSDTAFSFRSINDTV